MVHRRRSSINRRDTYTKLGLGVGVLMIFILILVMTQFGPSGQDEGKQAEQPAYAGNPENDPRLIGLREQVANLLSDYSDQQDQQISDEEKLNALEKIIELQKEVIRSTGSSIAKRTDIDLLENLQSQYEEEMAAVYLIKSKDFESAAEQAMTMGDPAEAVRLMLLAKDTQREINESYPRSSARNSARLQQLNNKILLWQTQPLAEQVDQLEQQAFAMVKKKEFAQALENISEALRIQESLNRDFRQSRFATLSRLKNLQETANQIRAAEDIDAVAALTAKAESAVEEGEDSKALELIEEAISAQRRVLQEFPDGNKEQQDALEELLVLRDTAASLKDFAKISELREQTRNALRSRDISRFNVLVSDWLRQYQSFAAKFKKSNKLAQLDPEEVEYLHKMRNQVPGLLEMTGNRLAPVPGMDGFLLYTTEIPQGLYESVTGNNPSSERYAAAPVESVTWNEANDFARRLGWILASDVTLPNKSVYIAALGNVPDSATLARSWSAENSGRAVQEAGESEPNPHGFHDLLGNVSEWIAKDVSGGTGKVLSMGGSARDSRARLATLPEEERSPDERNRFIGFRVMVAPNDLP